MEPRSQSRNALSVRGTPGLPFETIAPDRCSPKPRYG
jgi:hypothetical protein